MCLLLLGSLDPLEATGWLGPLDQTKEQDRRTHQDASGSQLGQISVLCATVLRHTPFTMSRPMFQIDCELRGFVILGPRDVLPASKRQTGKPPAQLSDYHGTPPKTMLDPSMKLHLD